MKKIYLLNKSSKTLYKGELVKSDSKGIKLKDVQRAHWKPEADTGLFKLVKYEIIHKEVGKNAKNGWKSIKDNSL